MRFLRSEEMGYYSLAISRDYAWEVMNELGELSSLQFIDLNSDEASSSRPFSNYIRRCDDIEAKLNSISHEMQRFGIETTPCDDPKVFLGDLKEFLASRNKLERTYFDDLEQELTERETGLITHVRSYESLVEKYNHLIEYKQVLLKTQPYILEPSDK